MKQRIEHIALQVKEYSEVIEFYTKKLDYLLLDHTQIDTEKCWLVIASPRAKELEFKL